MNPEPPQPTTAEVLRNLAFIIVPLGVAYYVVVTLGLDQVRDSVATAGIWAPLIVILLKASTIAIAPLGGGIIYPLAGALFGFWTGLALTLVGDALGSTIAFFISRYFGRSVLNYFTSPSQRPMVEKVITQLTEKWSFAKARVYFAGFVDLFAYAAGLTRIPFWFFIIVHITVHAPVAALYIAFGDLVVSGNWYLVVPLGLASTLLAIFGVWRFNVGLARGN